MTERTICALISIILGCIGCYLIGDIKLIFGIFFMMWADNLSNLHKDKP